MPTKKISLETISFESVIVHALPKHKKTDKEIQPSYSEQVSPLTPGLKAFFKDKVVESLRSDRALKLLYDSENPSPISALAKEIISGASSLRKKELVENSKTIARHLFETQSGANNEGILVIIPCNINLKAALILIKLEMDSGAQLVLNDKSKSFDIKEVEDLMLTKKTKVYKVALLLDKKAQGVPYDVLLADHQIDAKAKDEVKSWFINKFLGCKPFMDPGIITQRFYHLTKTFIDTIDDDLKRTKYHQDLNSYLLKNSSVISPKEFADDYLSNTTERNKYRDYLLEKKLGFDGFQKDVSQIENKIMQVSIEFANSVTLTSKTGSLEGKVKFEKTPDGQTRAEIISRVRKIK